MNGLIEDHGKFYSALDEYIIARLSHYLVEGSMFIWFQCDTQIRPTLTVYCTAATTSMHVYLIYVVLNDMLLLISARESPEPLSNYRSPQTPGHRAGEWLMVISAPNKQASPWQRQTSKLLLSSKLLIILRKHCKSLRNHRCISLVFFSRRDVLHHHHDTQKYALIPNSCPTVAVRDYNRFSLLNLCSPSLFLLVVKTSRRFRSFCTGLPFGAISLYMASLRG